MSTIAPTIKEHIEIVEGAGGPKARIIGHRIRVQDIAIWHVKLGESIDQILEQYPQLTRGDIYAALAYYWDHQDEIEQRIADDEALAAEMMRDHPSRLQDLLRERAQRGASHTA